MSYAPLGRAAPLGTAALGVYDRREPNPDRYPSCVTPDERDRAKAACRPVSIRGLGALGPFAGQKANRFEGANPCWVEQLPSCPSCLTKDQIDLIAYCIAKPSTAGCTWNNIGHFIGTGACTGVRPVDIPRCLSPAQKALVDYGKRYGFRGPDAQKNAEWWRITRSAAVLSGWQNAKECPKCLSKQQAMLFAAQIGRGERPTDPRSGYPLCPGETTAKAPSCLPWGDKAADPPGYDLVQYCKGTGPRDATKNAACYLFMRSPEYWRAISRLPKCEPKCSATVTCWDGSRVCMAMQAPGGPVQPTGNSCPPRPPRKPPPAPPPPPTEPPVLREPPPPAPPSPPPERPPVLRDGPVPVGPEPVRSAGLSTGSILLLAAAAGGGYYLWRRSRRGKKAA